MTAAHGAALPELDLRAWHAPASRPAFAERLRDVAHRSGFCYLTGHGITERRSVELLELARRFFDLPEGHRLAVENIHSPHFRGYTAAGRELTGGRMDWRELFDVGRERPALPLGCDDPPWRGLAGPNQWPAALPALRPALLGLLEELYDVGYALLSALALGLSLQEDRFADWFGDEAHARLKLLHYPARPNPDHDQGAGRHKDYGFLSMVLQDSQGGLQIADDQGGWTDMAPRPGTLVVNLGEMLELATDGYVLAATHRVLSPPTDADRTSIAFFLNPRLDAEITPLPLPPHLAGTARGSTQDPANPVFTTYGRNELKGWLRAHPRVARRHYRDVTV